MYGYFKSSSPNNALIVFTKHSYVLDPSTLAPPTGSFEPSDHDHVQPSPQPESHPESHPESQPESQPCQNTPNGTPPTPLHASSSNTSTQTQLSNLPLEQGIPPKSQSPPPPPPQEQIQPATSPLPIAQPDIPVQLPAQTENIPPVEPKPENEPLIRKRFFFYTKLSLYVYN